jgi:arylsulfatase A-like enzyme
MVEDLDDSVGAVLDVLQETGLAGNTLVFFWSDNGDVQMSPKDGPFRGRKFSQYEAGHRVPAVACWPGKIAGGTKSSALLAGFDLFPTFTAMAGIAADNPARLDGRSAMGHFLGQQPVPDRDLFFGYEPKLGTAMRRGPWKMIVKEDDVQLYHLDKDPKETSNVAADHPEVTKAMRQAIKGFKMSVVPGS